MKFYRRVLADLVEETKFGDVTLDLLNRALTRLYTHRQIERVWIALHFYQALQRYYAVPVQSIHDIAIENENDIGLIGPGHTCITRGLEYCLSWSKTFGLHAILHDCYGRFYQKYKKGPGYTYVIQKSYPCMKRNPLLGHLTGLPTAYFLDCVINY